MKCILTAICALALMSSTVFAAGGGPEIQIIDGKVSIQAEDISLGRLLSLLDRATGMKSQVPPELANRNVSVRFSDLDFDSAVRKIFEGGSLDYAVIGGQGIMVTAVAKAMPRITGPAGTANQSPFINQPGFGQDPSGFVQDAFAQDNVQPIQVMPPQPGNNQQMDPFALSGQQGPNAQQQPAVIQTPFGPIPNPNVRGNQPGNPNAAVPPASPTSPNFNNNSLFGSTAPPAFNQNNPAPAVGFPGLAPAPFPGSPQPVRK